MSQPRRAPPVPLQTAPRPPCGRALGTGPQPPAAPRRAPPARPAAPARTQRPPPALPPLRFHGGGLVPREVLDAIRPGQPLVPTGAPPRQLGPAPSARAPLALPAARPARGAPAKPRVRKATGDAGAAHWDRLHQEAVRYGQPLPSGGHGLAGLARVTGFTGIPAGVGVEEPELPTKPETPAHKIAAAPVGLVLRESRLISPNDPRLAGRNWSGYQLDVFDAVAAGTENLVIKAVAGSGKTTTLLKAVEFVSRDKRVLIVAFNKSIQKELQTRLPPELTNVSVSTLTAHANSILRRFWTTARYLRPDGGKGDPFGDARDNDVMWSGLPEWKRIDGPKVGWMLKDFTKLLGLCQSFLALTPAAIAAVREDYELMVGKNGSAASWTYASEKYTFNDDDLTAWVQRALAYRLQEPRGPRYAQRAFHSINKYAPRGLYDELTEGGRVPFYSFDDMTFVVAATPQMEPAEKFDVIFVDETQDMDVAQLALVFRSLAPGGKVVVVGDDKQAIYRFRGADSAGMARLERELRAKLLPLSVSYRVPACVAEEARHVVPQFEVPEGTPRGVCESAMATDMVRLWKAGDVVISRLNAPLVPLAMMAITQGINPWILGDENEAAQQLNRIVTDATRASPGDDSVQALRDYLEKREASVLKFRTDDMRKAAEKIRDAVKRYAALEKLDDDVAGDPKVVLQRLITAAFWNRQGTGLAQRKGVRSLSDVRDVLKNITPSAKRVEEMSPEEYHAHIRARLVISSVHRIKGGEHGTVWLLEETFKFGRGGRWKKKAPRNPKDAAEEQHLFYVAATRAKNEPGAPGRLYYVTGLKTLLGEDDAYDQDENLEQ